MKDGGSLVSEIYVRKQYALMIQSRDLRIDMGLATAEEIAAERAEVAARWRSLSPWQRFYRRQVRPRWGETRWRLHHAFRALRGIECERND